jgi:hypothetical protein
VCLAQHLLPNLQNTSDYGTEKADARHLKVHVENICCSWVLASKLWYILVVVLCRRGGRDDQQCTCVGSHTSNVQAYNAQTYRRAIKVRKWHRAAFMSAIRLWSTLSLTNIRDFLRHAPVATDSETQPRYRDRAQRSAQTQHKNIQTHALKIPS